MQPVKLIAYRENSFILYVALCAKVFPCVVILRKLNFTALF